MGFVMMELDLMIRASRFFVPRQSECGYLHGVLRCRQRGMQGLG
jgi:hypothetical protein